MTVNSIKRLNTNFSSFLKRSINSTKKYTYVPCMKVSNNGFLICIDVMFNTLSLNLMLPNSLTSPFSDRFLLKIYVWKIIIMHSIWSEFNMWYQRSAIIIDKCKEYVNFVYLKLRGFQTILFLKKHYPHFHST